MAVSELLLKFKGLAIRETAWAETFSDGTILPQDFGPGPEYCRECFEAARRIDIKLQGFERKIWKALDEAH